MWVSAQYRDQWTKQWINKKYLSAKLVKWKTASVLKFPSVRAVHTTATKAIRFYQSGPNGISSACAERSTTHPRASTRHLKHCKHCVRCLLKSKMTPNWTNSADANLMAKKRKCGRCSVWTAATGCVTTVQRLSRLTCIWTRATVSSTFVQIVSARITLILKLISCIWSNCLTYIIMAKLILINTASILNSSRLRIVLRIK